MARQLKPGFYVLVRCFDGAISIHGGWNPSVDWITPFSSKGMANAALFRIKKADKIDDFVQKSYEIVNEKLQTCESVIGLSRPA